MSIAGARPHWSNRAASWILAAAATLVGVHLAVVAPTVSPVTPPALVSYTTNVAATTVATPQRATTGRGHSDHDHD